jgi:hypothetical protein
VDKYVYNAASLERLCLKFERAYGMSSEDFYAAHIADDELRIPRFHRHVWASAYRDVRRLQPTGEDFASRAEHTLALA